jgi:protein O-mannosyl-transferase
VFPFLFSYVADHFQYLASLGIIVPLSAGLTLAAKRLTALPSEATHQPLRWATVLAALLLAVLGGLSWQQSHVYADPVTLYQTTIDRNPDCWMAYNNLGVQLINRKHPQEAIEKLERAVQLRDKYGDAYNNLGLAYGDLQKWDEAARYHRQAVSSSPKRAVFRNDLGIVLAHLDQTKDAAEEFRQALAIYPNFVNARINLGSAYTKLEQPRQALEQLQLALKLQPDSALAYMNAGIAYDELGQSQEAIKAAEQALYLARRSPTQAELAKRITNWLVAYRLKKANPSTTPAEK